MVPFHLTSYNDPLSRLGYSRYNPEVGDLVVGRITEVRPPDLANSFNNHTIVF